MVSLKKEAVEERLTNAVKYVHTLRSVGQKVVASNVTRLFHINNAYTPIFMEITGKETDIQGLCDEALKMARAINYKKKHPEVKSETAQKGRNPTTETPPQEVDIDRLRYGIRQEILAEMEEREHREFRYKREEIASECLYRLVAARPKESPEALANRAVVISDCLLKNLNNVE